MKKIGVRLLLVAFLEGFTTLAFQMVALRKAVPFVGSSVVLTSVVIGIILLALSAGYYVGGILTTKFETKQLLQRLQLYLGISALYYLLIVYPSFDITLQTLLQQVGYLPTLFLFALIFFAVPTFLASHTMPIITHISSGTKGYAAGKILFISTIGSFLGSTVTTLLLFPHMGVYWTGIVASGILFLCALLLGIRPRFPGLLITILAVLSTSIFWGNGLVQGYIEETPYQTIKIVEGRVRGQDVRVMQLNGGWASSIDMKSGKSFFLYIRKMYDIILEKKPKKIAVIGAAGCTLPQEIAGLDFIEQIDVIDIDARVFPVAEKHFLKQSLHTKIKPIVQSARGWIYDQIKQGHTYDMVIVDAYNGTSLPDELVTKEFFAGLKQLSPNIMINMITDKKMNSTFSRYFLSTLSYVFSDINWIDVSSTPSDYPLGNLVFTTFTTQNLQPVPMLTHKTQLLYTDDKNTVDHHRVALMYR